MEANHKVQACKCKAIKKRVRVSFRLSCQLKRRRKKKITFPFTGEGAGLTALKSDLFIQSNAGSNGTHFTSSSSNVPNPVSIFSSISKLKVKAIYLNPHPHVI